MSKVVQAAKVASKGGKNWLLPLAREPKVVYSDRDLIVVYKPSGLHTVNVADSTDTLATWLRRHCADVMEVEGRSKGDGGILHRLDGATAGLIVAARTQSAFAKMMEDGPFTKDYVAFSMIPENLEVVPAARAWPHSVDSSLLRWQQRLQKLRIGGLLENGHKFDITSQFEPFGPKGGRVRVVNVQGRPDSMAVDSPAQLYTSHCRLVSKLDDRIVAFNVTLERGFRHQVRAHLNYIGCPIINDPLYPIPHGNPPMPSSQELLDDIGLYAASVTFTQPTTGKRIKVADPAFERFL